MARGGRGAASRRRGWDCIAACAAAGGVFSLCGVAAAQPFADLPASLGLTATYRLHDGERIPIFGLGVYQVPPGDATYNAVKWALESGYRMIDTAMIYRNEESVGRAIFDSGIPRADIFLTTKLWDQDHGYEATLRACEESVEKLGPGIEYLDLYLIHSPNTGKLVETWDAMLEAKKRGLAHSVGVSNFNVAHLQLLAEHGREMPVVNQIEMHPLVYDQRLPVLELCREKGILVQAYGSIFFGDKRWLNSAEVTSVMAAHPGKTAAQILLRWGLQMGFQLIPKSTRKHRIEENAQIFDFELSGSEMATLSAMKGELGHYWNPLEAPVDAGRIDKGARHGGEL